MTQATAILLLMALWVDNCSNSTMYVKKNICTNMNTTQWRSIENTMNTAIKGEFVSSVLPVKLAVW